MKKNKPCIFDDLIDEIKCQHESNSEAEKALEEIKLAISKLTDWKVELTTDQANYLQGLLVQYSPDEVFAAFRKSLKSYYKGSASIDDVIVKTQSICYMAQFPQSLAVNSICKIAKDEMGYSKSEVKELRSYLLPRLITNEQAKALTRAMEEYGTDRENYWGKCREMLE